MRLWHILHSRLRSLLFRVRRESDLNEELQLHLERETERLQASGLSHEEARRQARRLFGGVEGVKEASREARGIAAWDALVRDTRHGLRRLAHDWRFTAAAVLILGLGIGVTTAMFSLVNAVLFRDQALPNPDRIVNIYQNDREGRPVATSYPAYLEMAEYKDVFDSIMATSVPDGVRYLDAGAVHNGVVEFTTPSYLDVLGLQPVRRPLVRQVRGHAKRAAGRGARASDLDQAVWRRSQGDRPHDPDSGRADDDRRRRTRQTPWHRQHRSA